MEKEAKEGRKKEKLCKLPLPIAGGVLPLAV